MQGIIEHWTNLIKTMQVEKKRMPKQVQYKYSCVVHKIKQPACCQRLNASVKLRRRWIGAEKKKNKAIVISWWFQSARFVVLCILGTILLQNFGRTPKKNSHQWSRIWGISLRFSDEKRPLIHELQPRKRKVLAEAKISYASIKL